MAKKYVKRTGPYVITITRKTEMSYNVVIREYDCTRERNLLGQWTRLNTSPFMDGIKKEMCFYVQPPIDDTIPLSQFEQFE